VPEGSNPRVATENADTISQERLQQFYNATPTTEEVRLVVLAFLASVNELGATSREPEFGGGSAMRLLGGVVVAASRADPADLR